MELFIFAGRGRRQGTQTVAMKWTVMGFIGETGVDDSDWVNSSCGDQSDNEGDLGFSDHGTANA
jgi:hypothetical protein